MGIHEDARNGTLIDLVLNKYLQDNPSILSEQDPTEGLVPLAAAVVGAYVDEVEQILGKGAKADALSRDGETPLLLAARKASTNRSRIIQLLLDKTPKESIDATVSTVKNNTPLMFVVQKKDVESVRLLRRAGASLAAKNDDGITAQEMAEKSSPEYRALEPDLELTALEKLSAMVTKFLLFIVAWSNDAYNGVMKRLYGLNPPLDDKLEEVGIQ